MTERSRLTALSGHVELLPGVTEEMLHPEYWTVRCEDHTTYSAGKCNDWFSQSDKIYRLTKDANLEFVMPTRSNNRLFDEHGQEIDESRWDEILTATAVRPMTATPGFAVHSADIRRWATSTQAFRTQDDREFDQFQDTTLHTFEPVIVIGESADSDWLYVYTTTYRGFVEKEAIAVTNWEEFERYQALWAQSQYMAEAETDSSRAESAEAGAQKSPAFFVVVTAPYTLVQPQPYDSTVSSRLLEFAAVLPLAPRQVSSSSLGRQAGIGNTCVLLPVRSRNGELEVHEAYVRSADVHEGFVPLNRGSCLQMAFTLLHERYGWGGRLGVHDCSSFIMDVYRTMGVKLPRDAGDQEDVMPNRLPFSEDQTPGQRCEQFLQLHAGDPLYMPGHTMMYIGSVDGRPYVIHDFAGYLLGEQEIPVNQVMVSSLDIHTRSGGTYLEALTSGGMVMVR